MKTAAILFCLCICLLLGSAYDHASEGQVQQMFEKRYNAWKSSAKEQQFKGCLANEEFYEIIDLGLPVIPLLVKKIEENPEDFHLAGAINIISRRRFAKSEWPQGKLGDAKTVASMYVQWWKEGRFETGERFTELHGKWETLKSAGKDEKAEDVYEQIVGLGLPVLPYLVEKVEQQPELMLAISELTAKAVPPTATADDCKLWWKEHKDKFELLTQSETNSVPRRNDP